MHACVRALSQAGKAGGMLAAAKESIGHRAHRLTLGHDAPLLFAMGLQQAAHTHLVALLGAANE